jgi:hypothetical protein
MVLVSLEGHYTPSADQTGCVLAGTDLGARHLIVMGTWRFTAQADDGDFARRMAKVACALLSLEAVCPAPLKTMVARGGTGLAHTQRQGNQAVSWYRGPLLPGAPDNGTKAPASPAGASPSCRPYRWRQEPMTQAALPRKTGHNMLHPAPQFTGRTTWQGITLDAVSSPDALLRYDAGLGLMDTTMPPPTNWGGC